MSPNPDSRLPTPDSRLPTPDSRLPIPCSLFPSYNDSYRTPNYFQPLSRARKD
ncbi:MAG: hypothetical protein F6J90_13130 [Moorea sp. SIOASIH]|uniref:hypothetical protein n=1 Tax=Moorena sp. SIOASIH TaxID=2607817 RepID=UPI0013B7BFB8|nr:hypothetical protein [Moorena sp. SIOASIH]NEO37210.1 hypothetical protein [Moorena sp. SIOASIH]